MRTRWGVFGVGLVCVLAPLVGCGGMAVPRHRIGSLPFPGPLTIYTEADPGDLGWHRYGRNFSTTMHPEWEVSRGTIYACRAGFLDVAHLRLTMDWMRYAHHHAKEAMLADEARVSFVGPHDTRVHIDLTYPPVWRDLPEESRERTAHEAAILVGQRASYIIWTWHEAITYEGHSSLAIFSEEGSAFGYDDMASHAVGLDIGAKALRDGRDFDEAATDHLAAELARLGAVSRECFREARDAVEDSWWTKKGPLVREFDAGVRSGRMPVMLVPGVSCCETEAPAGLPVPFGPNGSTPILQPRAVITFEPRTGAGKRLRERMGAGDRPLTVEDLAWALEMLEREDAAAVD